MLDIYSEALDKGITLLDQYKRDTLIWFVDQDLSCVNHNWKKGTVRNKEMYTSVVEASDEAFAITTLMLLDDKKDRENCDPDGIKVLDLFNAFQTMKKRPTLLLEDWKKDKETNGTSSKKRVNGTKKLVTIAYYNKKLAQFKQWRQDPKKRKLWDDIDTYINMEMLGGSGGVGGINEEDGGLASIVSGKRSSLMENTLFQDSSLYEDIDILEL